MRAKTYRERWADWIGCIAAIAFCISLAVRAHGMGFLLAPSLIHHLVIAASFLIRPAAQAKATGVAARVSSYGTTVLLPAYAALAGHGIPMLLPLPRYAVFLYAGAISWIAGCLLGLWGAWNLRYSFSIEPQARQLVMSGPYRWARHPMYSAYALQYFGVLLISPSVGLFAVLLAWYGLALVRIRFEERILTSVYPEYSDYRLRVGMFGPKLIGARSRWSDRHIAAHAGEVTG